MAQISFLLLSQVTHHNLTGPAQVLSRMPGARIELVAKPLDPVPTDGDVRHRHPARHPLRAGGSASRTRWEDEATLAWLRMATEGADWVTGVCIGTLALGVAGSSAVTARPRTGPATISFGGAEQLLAAA